jgi:hypothetical protein
VDQPVEDVHQRRLSGAVLAEQPVDLPWPKVEVDAGKRGGPREVFDDPTHLDAGGRSSRLRSRDASSVVCVRS